MTRIVLSLPTTTVLISLPFTLSLFAHAPRRIPFTLIAPTVSAGIRRFGCKLVSSLRRHSLFLCHRRSASLTPHSRLAPECTLHSVAHHSHTLFVLVPPKRPRSTQRPLLACSARVQCHCPSRSYSGSSQWFRVRAPTHWITTTRASLTPCSPQHSSTRRCPAPTAPQSACP